jgi:hypothetical protein
MYRRLGRLVEGKNQIETPMPRSSVWYGLKSPQFETISVTQHLDASGPYLPRSYV